MRWICAGSTLLLFILLLLLIHFILLVFLSIFLNFPLRNHAPSYNHYKLPPIHDIQPANLGKLRLRSEKLSGKLVNMIRSFVLTLIAFAGIFALVLAFRPEPQPAPSDNAPSAPAAINTGLPGLPTPAKSKCNDCDFKAP